jgi:uncharacterized damage-inducible protein DinB
VIRRYALLLLSLSLLLAGTARLQAAGIQSDVLVSIADIEKKVVALAEAMPEEKYSWRPAEGVRSVSEVFMHIASASYFLTGMIGVPAPGSVKPQEFEKMITKKADVVKTLKDSFAHVTKAVQGVSDADLEKGVNMFGQQRTYQAVLLTLVEHMSEHLGQSIAYARTNGVVPPWSQ